MFKSKGVMFGWQLALAAHCFLAFRADRFKVEHWVAAQTVAAGLVAQKSHKEGQVEKAKIEAGTPNAPAA